MSLRSKMVKIIFSVTSLHWSSWQLPQNPTWHVQPKLLWALNKRLYSQPLKGVFHLSDGHLDSNFTYGFAGIVQFETKSSVPKLIIHFGVCSLFISHVHLFSAFFFHSQCLRFYYVKAQKIHIVKATHWQSFFFFNHSFKCLKVKLVA